ncbi:hypothetical protein E1B28_008009 [Marasmius oreades]|uniref:DJ-1/PfpI domain-containing protein n=1 Tax=Marasmius oreades TaxID=181124 RepID=A0A9P7S351_9AGAR|nr:uncharacterized protein E1B28_008009 [Marasmius oreades]KAG7094410.1 hypothetical protein E1B28_008009 [Marasmius oreades]
MASPTDNLQPVNFGILLFPAFQALDVFGPLDALNLLSMLKFPKMNLSIIGLTLDPISTKDPKGSSDFGESVVPTHTISDPPQDLDVLLVPGGLGSRDFEGTTPIVDFIRTIYPSLNQKANGYLLTVCTGSWLAARAGVLDNKFATSNKAAWQEKKDKNIGPDVKWVSYARWVVDGNIWTGSGVAAGIDLMVAFIEKVYGVETANDISRLMEYMPHKDPHDDPFADLYGLPRENC